MSLLICGFHAEWHGKIINGIVKELGEPKTVIISSYCHELLSEHKVTRYDFQDFAYCEYHSIDFQSLLPIDITLIEALSRCQNNYLQMLERLQIKRGHKIGYQDRIRYFYNDLRIMNDILEKHNIDVCVIDWIPHLGFDYVLYELCKYKKIKVVMQFVATAIPYKTVSRYFLNDIFDPIPKLADICWDNPVSEIQLSERMQSYLDYYSGNKEKIKAVFTINEFKKKEPKVIKYLKSTIRMLGERNRKLLPAIKLRTEEFFRLKRIKKFINTHYKKGDSGEKYFYFPLHYQPECTTMPMASYYVDQKLVIDMVTALLPDDVKLYIKPHPNPSVLADVKFYKQLAENKKVCILPSEISSYDLIDNAEGIVTLTGTVAWESLVRKKPVMMFGYYYYQYAPGVFHVKATSDCKEAIQSILNKEYSIDEVQLKRFLQEFERYLVDGYMDDEYETIYKMDREINIQNAVKGYINYIRDDANWTDNV